jgi:hypothetical protein
MSETHRVIQLYEKYFKKVLESEGYVTQRDFEILLYESTLQTIFFNQRWNEKPYMSSNERNNLKGEIVKQWFGVC